MKQIDLTHTSLNFFESALLQNENPHNDLDEIVLNEPQSFWERVGYFFSGQSAAADKVIEFAKEKVEVLFKSAWGVTYEGEEKCAIDAVFSNLLSESGVTYRSLSTVAGARIIFEKIHQSIKRPVEGYSKHYEVEVKSREVETKYKSQEGDKIPGIIEAVGLEDNLYDITPDWDSDDPKVDAENVIKLLMGAPFDNRVFSWGLTKAIMFSKDKERMKGFKTALQKVAIKIFENLKSADQANNREQEMLAEVLLGNVLSLLPIMDPTRGQGFSVPQKFDVEVDGWIVKQWRLVEYRIEVLPLTSEWLGSSIPAIGLKPINDKAPPLLLFRGTPHPTANGAMLAMLSDIVPGHTVGEFVYNHSAKQLLQDWITEAHKKFGGVKIYGQSLGGITALTAVCHQPDKISEIHAYGSPSPLGSSLLNLYEKKCEEMLKEGKSKPAVHIYWNEGDLVPLAGTGFHPDWNLHKVIIAKPQSAGTAHAALNTAQFKVILMKLSVLTDRQSTARKVMNVIHQFISVVLAPLSLTLILLAFLKVVIITGCCKIYELGVRCLEVCQEQPNNAGSCLLI